MPRRGWHALAEPLPVLLHSLRHPDHEYCSPPACLGRRRFRATCLRGQREHAVEHLTLWVSSQYAVRRRSCGREHERSWLLHEQAAQPREKKERESRLTTSAAARELVATTKIVTAASRDPVGIGRLALSCLSL